MSDQNGPRRGRESGQNRLRQQEAQDRVRRRMGAYCLLVAATAFVAMWIGHWFFEPRAVRHRTVKVQVPAGGAGEALEQRGIIRSAVAFDLYVRWRGDAGTLRPGRYTLSPSMTLAQIVRQLKLGPGHAPDDVVRVAIPEGFTLRQIAARLEKEGVTDGSEFLQLALNPQSRLRWNYDFSEPNGPLEGYLYPDTYEFLPNTPPEKVLDEMLVNFSRRFTRPYHQQILASGSSVHTIVTIASLIEREAKVPVDRPRIAGVLENRLKKGMKLQIDATVLYALGYHKQRVLFRDLKVDSPYNTYEHAGLPPGPIASPGASALQAALMPEKNDYLYYVARPDGSHFFTRTPQEHEAAVRQARVEREETRGVEETSGGRSHEPQ